LEEDAVRRWVVSLAGLSIVAVGCGAAVSEREQRLAQHRARLATSMLMEGELGDALREARQSVEVDPRCWDCRLALGTVYAARSEFRQAEEELKKVLAHDPTNPFALNTLAAVYLNLGRPDEAETLAQRAAENENYEGRHLAYYNVGWAFLQQRKYSDALGAFSRALREAPQMCLAHFRIGEVFFRQRRYEEASHHLRQSMEPVEQPVRFAVPRQGERRSCEQMPDAHQLLGFALLAQGDQQGAQAAFRRCLTLATPHSSVAIRCQEQLNPRE
jgi:Tfp pilus assembly protein PilF